MAAFSILSGFKLALNGMVPAGYVDIITGQDLIIQFLSAEVCLSETFSSIVISFSRNYPKWISSEVSILISLPNSTMKSPIRMMDDKTFFKFYSSSILDRPYCVIHYLRNGRMKNGLCEMCPIMLN